LAIKPFHALFFCALLVLSPAVQAALPQPPCGTAQGFPSVDAAPVISVWQGAELAAGKWQPPTCTGWAGRSKLVVTLTASFHFEGTMDRLLGRLAAISTLRTVQYWSTTDKKWRPLAYDASALTGPDASKRRPDFSASDFSKGATLYYWMDDSRSGKLTYRMNILESTADRAVIASENITPVRRFFITLFDPGALQSVTFIQRLTPGVFGVYILSRTGDGTSFLAEGHDASYVNRAVALYRQLAGIKTDQEPPAAR
jgi:hypothetical protein